MESVLNKNSSSNILKEPQEDVIKESFIIFILPIMVSVRLLKNSFVFPFQRNVDNTFEGGKLNLLSLIQLWNLSLHLYLEKLHQGW